MPLIEQQDIVTVTGRSDADLRGLIKHLKTELESYPPVRIVSLSQTITFGNMVTLAAVIETV